MIILIDTNVILDYFISRKPFTDTAETILRLCFQKKCTGYIAAHSVTNIFFILRRQFSVADRKNLLIELCEFVEIADVRKKQVIDALIKKDFIDFEDCLQVECAKAVSADYIVTRNIADFSTSPIPVVLPEDFLEKAETYGLKIVKDF